LVDLSSAIYKSAKYAQRNNPSFFAHSLTQHIALKRVQLLMLPEAIGIHKIRVMITCLAVGMGILLVLFGKFWIF